MIPLTSGWSLENKHKVRLLLNSFVSGDWKLHGEKGLAWLEFGTDKEKAERGATSLRETGALKVEVKPRQDNGFWVVMCSEINVPLLEEQLFMGAGAASIAPAPATHPSVRVAVSQSSIFSEEFRKKHNTGNLLRTEIGKSGVLTHIFENLSIVDTRGGPAR